MRKELEELSYSMSSAKLNCLQAALLPGMIFCLMANFATHNILSTTLLEISSGAV